MSPRGGRALLGDDVLRPPFEGGPSEVAQVKVRSATLRPTGGSCHAIPANSTIHIGVGMLARASKSWATFLARTTSS